MSRPFPSWDGRQAERGALQLAGAELDVFLTMDQNLQYEQNLEGVAIAIIVLQCQTNRFDDLLPLVPRLIETLQAGTAAGEIIRIGV